MIKGILLTLGIEFVLLIVWVYFEAKRQIKEDEKSRFNTWEDWN
jgi:hypothetical protein